MSKRTGKISVCYVLSYKHPNYVRSLVLLDLLRADERFEVFEARNTTKNIFRYLETLVKLLKIRFRKSPDIYILGFRGYEIFMPVRLLTLGRPLIYDEFINLYDWFVHEHKKMPANSVFAWLIRNYSKWTLQLSDKVLTDTKLNAEFSARIHTMSPEKFASVYVGTDETTFAPVTEKASKSKQFEIFFYGNMLPLHGVEHLLEATAALKDKPIHFTIVGGKGGRYEKLIRTFLREHKRIKVTYHPWVSYKDLPDLIAKADVCLGGPFGGTSQGRKVITGKTFQFLAMGKAVIIGKIDEAVGFEDKINCLEVEQDSAEQLIEKINWAYQHRSKLQTIGEQGQKLYNARFSVQAQKHILAEIIDEAVRAK